MVTFVINRPPDVIIATLEEFITNVQYRLLLRRVIMFHQTKLFSVVGLLTQWALLLWLNQRLDLDPFVQIILIPLLMLSGMALLAYRSDSQCD
jgi:hypothetical protein